MFRVMLVEDELPVRDRIVRLIDWHSLGLEMAFVASDGQEAYEFLEDNDVDLILSDIHMPFMDGIELVRKVREKNDLCKIIFLTGYDNFQYAKDAIELDVYRYLQKPISKAELVQVLERVVEDLKSEIDRKREYFELKSEYEKQLSFFQDRLILDTLHSKTQYNDPKESFDKLSIKFENEHYRLAIIQILQHKESSEDYSMLNYSIFNYCKNIIEEKSSGRCIFGDQSRIILILDDCEIKSLDNKVFAEINKMMNSAKHIFKVSFSAGVSSTYRDVSKIRTAYNEAVSACQYAVVEGYNKLILSTDMEPIAPMYLDRLESLRLDLCDCIKAQSSDLINEKVSFYFSTLKFCKCSLDEVKSQLILLIMSIHRVFNNTINDPSQRLDVAYDLIQDIFILNDIDEVEVKVTTLMMKMTSKLKSLRESFKSNIVQNALDIIHESYKTSDLDSKKISHQLNVSASYFSRLFKQITGKTFVEYLTDYRMKIAKKLLLTTDKKVYEISISIGYDDPQYFSYNFRKHVGMTPSSYRKKRQDE